MSAAKLLILNPNEFDLWKMRIEQYFLMTNYSLWEVMLNGDAPLPTRVIEGVVQPLAPTIDEQRVSASASCVCRVRSAARNPAIFNCYANTVFATCTLLESALTLWNFHVTTVGPDVAYAMTWTNLRKKMTDKYCPRVEIKKLEVELWNLKVKESDKIEKFIGGLPDMIHESVMASKPKTMQDVIEFTTELMEKKISTFAKRQAENKRKFKDTSKNNQNQQQNKN
nr:hypothetical protein [Tanacetum cinerariifolium]